MLGYDWPRIHALLVPAPLALLTLAVALEIASLVLKRESLRAMSRLLLVLGALGAGAAVLAGLQAEDKIDHGPAIHRIMEEHEQLALITLGIFAVVAVWRLVRDRRMGGAERLAVLGVSVIGFAFLANTGHHGGELVFDHAAGVSNATLRAELANREEEHEHAAGEAHEHDAADAHEHGAGDAHGSAGASTSSDSAADSAAQPGAHTHPPGTPPHHH